MRPSIMCVVNWLSYVRGEILPRFKKFFELYFGCTGVAKIKDCPSIVVAKRVWSFSRQMPLPSLSLKRTKRPLIILSVSFNKHNRDRANPDTQLNTQISHLQWGLSHTALSCLYHSLRKMSLSATTPLILMKITDGKKGTMFIVIRRLKHFVRQLNPTY
jgi:hypothetical protein